MLMPRHAKSGRPRSLPGLALEWIANRPRGMVRRHGNLFDLRHPRMTPEIAAALTYGSYEEHEIRLIRRHIGAGDRVVELGVCVGVTTLCLFDLVGANALVAYEADPANLGMADRNFRLNAKAVDCRNAALVSGPDRPATIRFASNANPSSSSLIPRKGTVAEIEVPAVGLSEALEAHGATALVLDIEGGEIELFAGAGDLPGLSTILLETHVRIVGKKANDAMLRGLAAKGFRVVEDIDGGAFLALSREGDRPPA